ncbi:MAG: aminotransferase class V-fold PLP-dependent enzyme, partial [Xanthomonadales bacterium]|nr:aminotransferase class V-fold PLP-dependent enzyme [Xanthomonadales bacterium]
AGLAFQIKDHIGVQAIEAREHELLERTFERWQGNPAIEIMGNPDPARRISIVSFNLRDHRGKYLHPKFVTTLLNDLFGVQSRAGCSCAGPYGHRLLDIGYEKSEQYRKWITKGFSGIKPGWCRISLHYAMDNIEVDYILDAIEFVAEQGYRFMSLYDFDMHTGAWLHKADCVCLEGFSLDAALECRGYQSRALSEGERKTLYGAFLSEARKLAEELAAEQAPEEHLLNRELEELKFFSVPKVSVNS